MFKKLFILSFILFDYSMAKNVVDVNTSSGVVRGHSFFVLNQTINQFLGIPYAEPPLGTLRFARPKPIVKQTKGIIDAIKSKHSCIQFGMSMFIYESEDCLLLNIWSAQNESLKPVMFWIHGGGFTIGSIFNIMFNGVVLATHDVVIVTTNYRLGPLGFLYSGEESTPGNVAFYDQLMALQWVRDNIHLFGGDKNQITIFGQSAGSTSVSAHLLSPLSKGMFKRAIMQSEGLLHSRLRSYVTKKDGIFFAKRLAKKVNCTINKRWLDCLRKVDVKRLKSVESQIEFIFPVEGTEFLPLSAQKAFSENKFNRDLDIMAGVCKDEGSHFSSEISQQIRSKNLTEEDSLKILVAKYNLSEIILKSDLNTEKTNDSAIKAATELFGDIMIKCPTYLFAKWYAINSKPETNVFFYELNHSIHGSRDVPHSSDLDFTFGLLLLIPKLTTTENIEMSKDMVRMWTNFAKTGKPDPNWPKLIDTTVKNSDTYVKNLKPGPAHYFRNLFTKSCEGIFKDYY